MLYVWNETSKHHYKESLNTCSNIGKKLKLRRSKNKLNNKTKKLKVFFLKFYFFFAIL
jgi:hypothetical protein